MTSRAMIAGFLALISGGCVANSDAIAPANEKSVAGGKVEVSVEAIAPNSAVGEALEVRVTAHNTGKESVTFLIWNTPFESPLSADVFDVTREGKPVDYTGIMLRRALPPADSDFRQLEPDAALEQIVDLRESYPVDVTGSYAVSFEPKPLLIDGLDRAIAPLVSSGEPATLIRD